MTTLQIASPHILRVWEDFAYHLLVPAMRRFWWDYTPDQVLSELLAGRMQLWVVPEKAALVTKIDQMPSKKLCTVILGGGRDAKAWCRMSADIITAWAKEQGCTEIRIIARRGWSHYLSEATELGAVFSKRLSDD